MNKFSEPIDLSEHQVINGIITNAETIFIPHFNIMSINFCIKTEKGRYLFLNGRALTKYIGIIWQSIIELVNDNFVNDSEYKISELIGKPVRVILDKENNIIGFGHFMQNEFIIEENFIKKLTKGE